MHSGVLWLLSSALAGDAPEAAGPRAKTLAAALVYDVGPRPAQSRSGSDAQAWARRALIDRGWDAQALPTWPGAVYACQAGEFSDVVLFLAHTDSVPGVPGGNDNAAAVGVLLTAAELLRGVRTPRTVCLGFPDAEESGLIGAFTLQQATERGVLGGRIDQVMALDLVGVGTLTHNGLGPPFGARRLRALLSAAPADVPWVYRAVSQARPELERSDHHPFNLAGIPASHLMARGPSGFDWQYHSPGDTVERLEVSTLHAAVGAVVAVATADLLPEESAGSPAFVLPWLGLVLPGWVCWLGIGSGACGAAVGAMGQRVSLREVVEGTLATVAQAILATLALGLAMFVATGFRRLDVVLADPVVLAGWAAWGAVVLGAPVEGPEAVRRGLGGLAAMALAAAVLWLGVPLLALPLAIAALGVGLSRFHPAAALISAWPAAYLLRPDTIRELHFHGLFPAEVPWWTGLGGLVLLPLLGALPSSADPRRQRVAVALGLVAVSAIVAAWLTPEVPGG